MTLARSGCGSGPWQQVGIPFGRLSHPLDRSKSILQSYGVQLSEFNGFYGMLMCSHDVFFKGSNLSKKNGDCFLWGYVPISVGIGIGAFGDFSWSSTGKQWKTRALGWYCGGEESNGLQEKSRTRCFFCWMRSDIMKSKSLPFVTKSLGSLKTQILDIMMTYNLPSCSGTLCGPGLMTQPLRTKLRLLPAKDR